MADRATVKALDEAGYTRYQERTATMLGDLTEHLQERWGGDPRRLRDDAGRDPGAKRARLKEFKGVGDVGVDIFLREVQVAWDEHRPFADRRAFDAAGRLGLPKVRGSWPGLRPRPSSPAWWPRSCAPSLPTTTMPSAPRPEPQAGCGRALEAGRRAPYRRT
jgi:hypothetical protein